MKIETKIGPLYLVASAHALHGVHWHKQNIPMIDGDSGAEEIYLKKAAKQLADYLDGTRQEFDLELEAEGTDFQKKVWRELAKIPYGETRSYKEIAALVKNSKACRAVGTANGRNPISIIVPCHRVIASDATMGGYAGGLSIKEKLLTLERTSRKK